MIKVEREDLAISQGAHERHGGPSSKGALSRIVQTLVAVDLWSNSRFWVDKNGCFGGTSSIIEREA